MHPIKVLIQVNFQSAFVSSIVSSTSSNLNFEVNSSLLGDKRIWLLIPLRGLPFLGLVSGGCFKLIPPCLFLFMSLLAFNFLYLFWQVLAVISLTITDMKIHSEGKIEDLTCIRIEYLTLFRFWKACHGNKQLGNLQVIKISC